MIVMVPFGNWRVLCKIGQAKIKETRRWQRLRLTFNNDNHQNGDALPSAKRRTARRSNTRLVKATGLHKRLSLIDRAMAALKRSRALVRRDEFAEVQKSLRQLRANTDDILEHTKDLATQFTRIAQIQAELDVIKATLKKRQKAR
jgi:hypothetical protein